uniref:HTH CENPB-type domain-containing protein n=1 Tax=Salarias fasciatus TaxID=181472 RepID=A0A672IHH5_SALFA
MSIHTRRSYDTNFKLMVINAAESSNNCQAAKRYGVAERLVRYWRAQKKRLQNASAMRKAFRGPKSDASERLIEGVTRKMIRVKAKEMFTTVSDSSDERFSASAGWLDRFLHRNNFTCRRRTTVAQKDAKEFTEKLVKFVRFSSRMIETMKIPEKGIIAMDETAVWFDMVGSTTAEQQEEDEEEEFNNELVVEDDDEEEEEGAESDEGDQEEV